MQGCHQRGHQRCPQARGMKERELVLDAPGRVMLTHLFLRFLFLKCSSGSTVPSVIEEENGSKPLVSAQAKVITQRRASKRRALETKKSQDDGEKDLLDVVPLPAVPSLFPVLDAHGNNVEEEDEESTDEEEEEEEEESDDDITLVMTGPPRYRAFANKYIRPGLEGATGVSDAEGGGAGGQDKAPGEANEGDEDKEEEAAEAR